MTGLHFGVQGSALMVTVNFIDRSRTIGEGGDMASLSVDDYDSDGGQKCNRRGQCHQSNHASKIVAALRRSKISFVIHAGSHSYVRLFAARDHHVISGLIQMLVHGRCVSYVTSNYIVSHPEQIDKSIKAQVLRRYQIGYS